MILFFQSLLIFIFCCLRQKVLGNRVQSVESQSVFVVIHVELGYYNVSAFF